MVEHVKTEERQPHDAAWMTKFWKDNYLQGLETLLQGQEEAERMFADTVKQSLVVQKQWLHLTRQWASGGALGSSLPGPAASLTKQYTDNCFGQWETALKTSEETFQTSLTSYQSTVAASLRQYIKELNAQLADISTPV